MTATASSVNLIALTRGYVAYVDAEDFEYLSTIKWRAKVDPDGRAYAMGHQPGSGHHGKSIFMHRVVLGETDPLVKVDHRDGNGLNNRRSNLRRSTNAQNIRNQKPHRDKRTSKLKGVSFLRARGKFRAQIMLQYKKINLGDYATEEQAGRVYDQAAIRLHGEFARPNFPAAPRPPASQIQGAAQ